MRVLINIDVPDLQTASAFYQAALGLTRSRMLDDDVVELSGAGSTIYLLQKPAGSAVNSADDSTATRSYARHWTPVHLDSRAMISLLPPSVRCITFSASLTKAVA